MSAAPHRTAGLVLAAGGGRRLVASLGPLGPGPEWLAPKGLVTDEHGEPWAARAAGTLREGGCEPVLVVAGAGADLLEGRLSDAVLLACPDWASGLGASLRHGLAALHQDADAVVVTHADLPGLPPSVVRRLIRGAGPESLARGSYAGMPGHPVLIGRAHVPTALAEAAGDHGARELLRGARLVECGDLFDGRDVDLAADLPAGHTVTLLDPETGQALHCPAAPPTPGRGAAAAG